MPSAVVTGVAGFLGSHLSEYLLAEGYRVICVDNLETSSLSNLEHIRDDAFTFLNHDVIDTSLRARSSSASVMLS